MHFVRDFFFWCEVLKAKEEEPPASKVPEAPPNQARSSERAQVQFSLGFRCRHQN